MLLFLMIPLALLATTIALGPILSMTVVHDREVRAEYATIAEPVRLPRPVDGSSVPGATVDERELARAA